MLKGIKSNEKLAKHCEEHFSELNDWLFGQLSTQIESSEAEKSEPSQLDLSSTQKLNSL